MIQHSQDLQDILDKQELGHVEAPSSGNGNTQNMEQYQYRPMTLGEIKRGTKLEQLKIRVIEEAAWTNPELLNI